MKAKLIAIAAVLLSNVAFSQPSSAKELSSAKTKNTLTGKITSTPASITKSQAKAAKLFLVVENFANIDTNQDGVVTRNELRLYALSTRRYVPMT